MKHIHKQALLFTVLFSNVSLSLVSSLALDESLQNSLTDSNGYSVNLLNSNTKPIKLSSFEPVIGIRLPRIKPRWPWVRPNPVPRPRPRPWVKPIPRPKIEPGAKFPSDLLLTPSNSVLSNAISNAFSKSKQKPSVQKFLNDMSPRNASILDQRLRADVKKKIQSQFLINDLHSQVQNLSNQAFQEAAESHNVGSNAAYNLLALRYDKKGLLTKQDTRDADLAAQRAIQEQRRHQQILVLSGATTTTVTAIAVASATRRVKADNDKLNLRTLLQNRYPLYRLS